MLRQSGKSCGQIFAGGDFLCAFFGSTDEEDSLDVEDTSDEERSLDEEEARAATGGAATAGATTS